MKPTRVVCLTVSLLLGLLARPVPEALAKDEPAHPMAERHQRFLERDARWIITRAEREVFEQLPSDAERDEFMDAFWLARDPTPGTNRNEFKREHYRRIDYAERQLGRDSPRPGYATDRGQVYIRLGEPQEIKYFYSSAWSTYPMELWFYQAPKQLGLPSFFYVLFYKKRGIGEYRLYSPIIDGPENLIGGSITQTVTRQQAVQTLLNVNRELAQASLSLVPSEPVDLESGSSTMSGVASQNLLGRINDLPDLTFQPDYLERWGGGRGVTRSEVAYIQFEAQVDTWAGFDRQGDTWLSLSLLVPPEKLTLTRYEDSYGAALKLLGTLEDSSGTIVSRIDENIEVQLDGEQFRRIQASPLSIESTLPVLPGDYQLRLILRNQTTGSFGAADTRVSVPEPLAATQISEPLVAHHMEQVGAARYPTPYYQAGLKMSPIFGGQLARGEQAAVYYQIRYPTSAGPQRLSKSLSLERDGEEVVGQIGFIELDPEQDGGLVHVVEELNVRELDAGDYTLVIRVEDAKRVQLGQKRMPLRLTIQRVRRPWTFVRSAPQPAPRLAYARQLRASGQPQQARALLELELAEHPTDAGARLELVELLLLGEQPQAALDQLDTLEAAGGSGWLPLSLRAAALMGLDRYTQAGQAYAAAIEQRGPEPNLLNAMGEAWARAGELQQARDAFQRSLELAPDQQRVREALMAVGGTPPAAEPVQPAGAAAGTN